MAFAPIAGLMGKNYGVLPVEGKTTRLTLKVKRCYSFCIFVNE